MHLFSLDWVQYSYCPWFCKTTFDVGHEGITRLCFRKWQSFKFSQFWCHRAMLETLILGSIFPAWTLILRWARWSARVSPMLRIPICLPWSLAWRNNRYPENVWREVPIARIPEHSETSCLHFSTLSLQLKKYVVHRSYLINHFNFASVCSCERNQ